MSRSSRTGQPAKTLRLGVLAASSSLCPAMAESLIDGLRAALAPVPHELFIETIGSGGKSAGGKLSRLVLTHRPDVIVGMIGAGTIRFNDSEFASCGRPLINVTLGADAVTPLTLLPNLLTLSAGTWQAAMAASACSIATGARRAALVSSFYDCGYDAYFAMRSGFEAGGGEVTASIIIDAPRMPCTAEQALVKAVDSGAEVILALLSGPAAESLIRAWHESPFRDSIPLIGPAFLTEEPRLRALGRAAEGVGTVATWTDPIGEAAGSDFDRAYATASDDIPPDLFAVLGWEAGHLLREGLRAVPAPARNPLEFVSALENWQFESPRGRLQIHQGTRSSNVPLHLRTVREGKHQILHALSEIPPDDERMKPVFENEQPSGWANEYLCI